MFNKNIFTFQNLIIKLQEYWVNKGYTLILPIDIEVGAATSHPITTIKSLNMKKINVIYTQASRRPEDSNIIFNINPYKLQHYYQFQVISKPSPNNIKKLYLDSLKYLNINLIHNDIKFIEDNWENPTLSSWGIGWEIWLNSIEITQFTYFKQICGIKCNYTITEITYGLERIAMFLQNKNNIFDIIWSVNNNNIITYGDLFYNNELEFCKYNINHIDINFIFNLFNEYEKELIKVIKLKYLNIAYEYILKLIQCFNKLEARKVFSNIEKKRYIINISNYVKSISKIYLNK